jgi:hypothetical protein
VLELSKHEWVELHRIEVISPQLARDYAQAGDRMLQRDLNSISRMGLIDRKYGRVRARTGLIQAFLPGRVAP